MKPIDETSLFDAAKSALEYLAATDPLPAIAADAVIGFGTFDVTLASFCGDLYAEGRARRIVFTGGLGAGTADLGMPEADAWQQQLAATHPQIPAEHVLIENRSTNTAENIAFTQEVLIRADARNSLGEGTKRVLIVASPSRLRRVKLTLQAMHPRLEVTRCLPAWNFDRERSLHEAKGIDYLNHLLGELDRIVTYAECGWIAREPLPPHLLSAQSELRRALSSGSEEARTSDQSASAGFGGAAGATRKAANPSTASTKLTPTNQSPCST